MARAGIHYTEVKEAAEALIRENVTPTHERIRQRLGAGSFSTISKFLQRWRTEDAPDVHRTGTRPGSAPPPNAVEAAVQDVWQRMHDAAQERILDAERMATERIQEIQDQAEAQMQIERQSAMKAGAARDTLAQTLDQIRLELREAREQLAESMAQQHALAQQCQTLQDERTHADARALRMEHAWLSMQEQWANFVQTYEQGQIARAQHIDAVTDALHTSIREQFAAIQDVARAYTIQLDDSISDLMTHLASRNDFFDALHTRILDLSQNVEQRLNAFVSVQTEILQRLEMNASAQEDITAHLTTLDTHVMQKLQHLESHMTTHMARLLLTSEQNSEKIESIRNYLLPLMTTNKPFAKSA